MHFDSMRRRAGLLACFAVAALLSGCASIRNTWGTARATVAGWSDDGFLPCTPDPRILCEPGAESYANALAPLLPAAIAKVERVQGAPFAGPVRMRIYIGKDSYTLYSGGPGGAAKVALGGVHMSPMLKDRPEWQAGFIEHELSHLHLGQRTHHYAMLRLPHWFREGYATWVSDGGGAQTVTREQALFMLVHGRHLEAVASEFPLLPRDSGYYRMEIQMYYRQAALVVDYMAQRDRAAFCRMLDDIVAGKRFGPAVQDAYGRSMDALWTDFLAGVRADPATRIAPRPTAATAAVSAGNARPR
jgi:hypothetical protein